MAIDKTGMPDVERAVTMDKLIALCKNRGFIFPGSEIYGGLANTWDYGYFVSIIFIKFNE